MRPVAHLLLVVLSSCGSHELSSSLKEKQEKSYPQNPQESVTPGALCEKGGKRTYAKEEIIYCSRDVSSDLKKEIIADYDRLFHYEIGAMQRSDFKIDHYVPLCFGGSNEAKNLWPQHKTVYTKTDQIEQYLCDELRAGKRLRADAVEAIKDVKRHLEKADDVLAELKKRRK